MSSTDSIEQTRLLLSRAKAILVITGAGISAESGIPTFRGPDTQWRGFDPTTLATPEAFAEDPQLVWEWYDWRRTLIAGAEPNLGHGALARLQQSSPRFLLVTQNVDGLHQRAGSTGVAEIHGSIWKVRRADDEGPEREDFRAPLPPEEIPPRDPDGTLLRPAIVWYGESLRSDALFRMQSFAAEPPDVALVIGTSGQVTWVPAVLSTLRQSGSTRLINLNPDPGPLSRLCHVNIAGTASSVLPQLVPQAG